MKLQTLALAVAAVTVLSACKDKSESAEATPSTPTVAKITMVDTATKEVKTPHQVCVDVAVTQPVQPKDEGKLIGTIGGAAAGAALGNQIGGGSGKVIATAAGTIAGALAGRTIQENVQANDVVTTTQKQCHTEYTTSTKVIGYNVTYKFDGASTTVRMANKPTGNTFPVKDGKVIVPN